VLFVGWMKLLEAITDAPALIEADADSPWHSSQPTLPPCIEHLLELLFGNLEGELKHASTRPAEKPIDGKRVSSPAAMASFSSSAFITFSSREASSELMFDNIFFTIYHIY
jgi:hypothetical protein